MSNLTSPFCRDICISKLRKVLAQKCVCGVLFTLKSKVKTSTKVFNSSNFDFRHWSQQNPTKSNKVSKWLFWKHEIFFNVVHFFHSFFFKFHYICSNFSVFPYLIIFLRTQHLCKCTFPTTLKTFQNVCGRGYKVNFSTFKLDLIKIRKWFPLKKENQHENENNFIFSLNSSANSLCLIATLLSLYLFS